MKAELSIKLILYFAPNCPRRIVAPNCPRRIVQRRIVRAELSAPNCPAPNCPGTIFNSPPLSDNSLLAAHTPPPFLLFLHLFVNLCSSSSFIHSHHFYSASSSPLRLRGALDTARILCSE